jgi:hypothetical protein
MDKLGKVRLPSPDGVESAINFYQMNLPQPQAPKIKPRAEDEDGNELAQCDPADDTPLEEGGYTRNEARQIFPSVVIRPVKFIGGSDGDLWGTLTVVITVGTFDESSDCSEGLKQVANILERSRQLFEKVRLLENRHKIILPVQYELYDESVRPFWFGEMITEWRIRLQSQEFDTDDDFRLGVDGKGEGGIKYG